MVVLGVWASLSCGTSTDMVRSRLEPRRIFAFSENVLQRNSMFQPQMSGFSRQRYNQQLRPYLSNIRIPRPGAVSCSHVVGTLLRAVNGLIFLVFLLLVLLSARRFRAGLACHRREDPVNCTHNLDRFW
ncbi:hypothetical protein GE09DRAFT_595528 [Coniochaeta sp. 2T2.1]|nr:hypothetical protein GE09DRAFT_595528 [Coniochaeta sp. 2T2.1]